jgi:hypothetical protein
MKRQPAQSSTARAVNIPHDRQELYKQTYDSAATFLQYPSCCRTPRESTADSVQTCCVVSGIKVRNARRTMRSPRPSPRRVWAPFLTQTHELFGGLRPAHTADTAIIFGLQADSLVGLGTSEPFLRCSHVSIKSTLPRLPQLAGLRFKNAPTAPR